MCITLKYGIWNIQAPEPGAVNALVGGGYPPLSAMVLAARGLTTPKDAGLTSTATPGCMTPS